MSQEVLLSVKDLRTEFFSSKTSSVTAIKDVSFDMYRGEVLGLVGESGCGKSVTSLSIMQLLKDTPGKVTNGSATLDGVNLVEASDAQIRDIRGGKMSMIFQEPMSALNPSMRIDKQMIETIRLHQDMTKEQALAHAADMLKKVGIPDPARVLKNYPHQLSGGMSQRVMIAMALSNNPELLIADEPTTALDVTIQAQILDLMKKLQKEDGSSILLITHDLGVVAEMCTRVIVMYAGKIVEMAPVEKLFATPSHPYTQGLIASVPKLGSGVKCFPVSQAAYRIWLPCRPAAVLHRAASMQPTSAERRNQSFWISVKTRSADAGGHRKGKETDYGKERNSFIKKCI